MDRPVTLASGTIETLVVELQDALGTVTDLSTATPTYSVVKADVAETHVVTDAPAIANMMTLLCQIDATSLAEGDYDLFVSFVVGDDTPRLYVGRFRVE